MFKRFCSIVFGDNIYLYLSDRTFGAQLFPATTSTELQATYAHENCPMANKCMGKCFDRVKLVSLCTRHDTCLSSHGKNFLCIRSTSAILQRLFGASGLVSEATCSPYEAIVTQNTPCGGNSSPNDIILDLPCFTTTQRVSMMQWLGSSTKSRSGIVGQMTGAA